MRILFVGGEFPPQTGGVGDYTDRLAGALADQGAEVGVLTAAPAAGPTVANRDAVWATRDGAAVWRTVERWDLRAWRLLAARIHTWRPDVVHLQYQAAAFGMRGAVALYPWLLRTWNIRPLSVVTFHDLLTPHLFPLSGRLGLDRAAVAWLARGADAAIATNAADAALLVRHARRVWQVPIGANIAPPAGPFDRAGRRAELGVAAADPLIAYFGFYNASKGLEALLEAFAGLSAERPRARLLLIGGGAGQTDVTNVQYGEHLRRRVEELALTDRLIWTGYEEGAAVSAHLRAADVVVLPFRDGASLRRGTLMAALGHGCAIVTTTPPGPLPELDGAVVFCPPDDPGALQRAMQESLEEGAQRHLRAAALRAAEQFMWPTIAAAHTAVYRALCRSDC